MHSVIHIADGDVNDIASERTERFVNKAPREMAVRPAGCRYVAEVYAFKAEFCDPAAAEIPGSTRTVAAFVLACRRENVIDFPADDGTVCRCSHLFKAVQIFWKQSMRIEMAARSERKFPLAVLFLSYRHQPHLRHLYSSNHLQKFPPLARLLAQFFGTARPSLRL